MQYHRGKAEKGEKTDHIGDGGEHLAASQGGNDTVTVDSNRPLAGVQLKFEVKIVNIRDATTEVLEHGHAHGPEDHYH
ncbi:MAG: hypothetical protein L3J88_11500 [Gammaproteobacteria bacterium]|nr:hypothetical protein [Gammaproteobacteria bacterium]MCF6363943.1 hypothetical protein [Gammaproteobacteria bacterium]